MSSHHRTYIIKLHRDKFPELIDFLDNSGNYTEVFRRGAALVMNGGEAKKEVDTDQTSLLAGFRNILETVLDERALTTSAPGQKLEDTGDVDVFDDFVE
jgi:hypothetical protein